MGYEKISSYQIRPRGAIIETFYRLASEDVGESCIEPIENKRHGLRNHVAMLKGRRVALKMAPKISMHGRNGVDVYQMFGTVQKSDFVFYLLGDSGSFLFVPKDVIPPTNTRFRDSDESKYYAFKDNFDALEE